MAELFNKRTAAVTFSCNLDGVICLFHLYVLGLISVLLDVNCNRLTRVRNQNLM